MALTRAQARDLIFQRILPLIDGEFANAITSFPGTIRSADDVIDNLGTLDQEFRANTLNALRARRVAQNDVAATCGVILDQGLAAYMQAISSSAVDGAVIRDRSLAMFDFRASLIANEEYVASKGDSFATDPTPADGLILRRLTVDHLGQPLQGGRRETVTFEVLQTAITGAGARQVSGTLYGNDGPDDALDRAGGTARSVNVALPVYNEIKRGGISNSVFTLSGAPSNGTAIPNDQTVLGPPWTQTDTGSPTVVVRTTNLWRSKTNGIAISGNSTAREFSQALVVPAAEDGAPNAYTPVDILTVVYWDNTWTGNVIVTWGSKSQTFAHSTFSGAGFKYLVPTLDKNLYPVNFTTTDPKFKVKVETTSASGELVLHYADLQRMTARQGHYYSAWSHTNDPAEGTKKTWADTCTFGGAFGRAVWLAYEGAAYAYLPTSSAGFGSPSLLSPPTNEPEISATYGGSNLADGGTIALGSVATGAHSVTVRFKNSGKGLLALGVPTQGSVTNASLTNAGLSAPAAIDADTDAYLDITFEVTSSSPGAFSCVINVSNNDSDENPFNFTVSGVAT